MVRSIQKSALRIWKNNLRNDRTNEKASAKELLCTGFLVIQLAPAISLVI